jgi:hypothetical protein
MLLKSFQTHNNCQLKAQTRVEWSETREQLALIKIPYRIIQLAGQ